MRTPISCRGFGRRCPARAPSSTIDLPSGVWIGHRREDARPDKLPGHRTRRPDRSRVALRLPMVIVPVLSSSSVSMSPAVSTALPDLVMTLARSARSIPAMPMAESRPPMVVGIRQTNSEMNAAIGDVGAHVVGKGFERGADDDEHQREAGQQDGQRDFVGRLLARGAFHEGDHLVEETFARHAR